MVDKEIRTINRAICEVEDQDLRERARGALHRVFRRELKLKQELARHQRDIPCTICGKASCDE